MKHWPIVNNFRHATSLKTWPWHKCL